MTGDRHMTSVMIMAMAQVAGEKGIKKTALSLVAVAAASLDDEEERLMFEAIEKHIAGRNEVQAQAKTKTPFKPVSAEDWLKAYQESGGRSGGL